MGAELKELPAADFFHCQQEIITTVMRYKQHLVQ